MGLASFQSGALGFNFFQSYAGLPSAASDLVGILGLKSLCLLGFGSGEMVWSLVIPQCLLLSHFPCTPSFRVVQIFLQRQRVFLSHATSLCHLQTEGMFPLLFPFGSLYLTDYARSCAFPNPLFIAEPAQPCYTDCSCPCDPGRLRQSPGAGNVQGWLYLKSQKKIHGKHQMPDKHCCIYTAAIVGFPDSTNAKFLPRRAYKIVSYFN